MSDQESVEINNSRLFEATVETLYDAFADPGKLALWWGPHGFTNTIHGFDLRPGGTWLITMQASDGTDFLNRSTFQTVEPLRRIVFLHHEPLHVYTLEMTFSAEESGSRLDWCMRMERNDETLFLEKFIAAANEQNFERLEAVLRQG
ncbi:SRPBCC domain-containing protein [Rhizobium sp. CAU 1783]